MEVPGPARVRSSFCSLGSILISPWGIHAGNEKNFNPDPKNYPNAGMNADEILCLNLHSDRG
jgi:hypothetical protein